MLGDEKYKGDCLLQKYYTDDFLTKKLIKNSGEVPQYYVEDHHEPIVSAKTFDEAKERELQEVTQTLAAARAKGEAVAAFIERLRNHPIQRRGGDNCEMMGMRD